MTFKAQEIRALLKLTFPILATQLAQIGMGTVDTLMSGYVSTRDLAAVAIGTSLWLPTWLFLAGVLVALSPLASGLNAARRNNELPNLLAAALWVGIVLGSLSGLLLWAALRRCPCWWMTRLPPASPPTTPSPSPLVCPAPVFSWLIVSTLRH